MRITPALGVLLACLLSMPLADAAGEPDAPGPDRPAKGLRIFTCAHSFHGFVPGLLEKIAESAGIEGHVQLGKSGIGGSKVI